MRGISLTLCRAGFVAFILLSCVSENSAMSLDLTELRNKVSEIKLNPRWNLWATGHFMGKKSVAESSFGKVPAVVRGVSPQYHREDVQTLLIQILKPQWMQAVASGKTRRAEELKAYFEQNGDKKVYIVGDGGLDVDRNTVYADSQKEKDVRSSLKAEVERKINKDDVVILDSLNYIKGYRYELFCLVKHAQTPHCLVYCLTSDEVSSRWNVGRDAAERYNQDIFDALVLRFEAPDSRNRWDSPLFTILKDDTLPYEDISDALFKRKAPPPNQSTQSQPLSSANFLYELDKITQDVLVVIFNAQKTSVPGDLILVPGATEKIQFNRSVNMAELRKLRRQFISYTKMHPTENTGHVSNMFVQYLNKSLH